MNTDTTKPKPTEPVLYQIWHRENRKGARWVKAGRTSTHAEAVTLCGSKGDWWISPLHDPALAGDAKQPTLLD